MRSLFGSVARSGLICAAIGLPVLGVGGRLLMRVIAHWEDRVPVLTAGGTFRVLFVATMAGLTAGIVRGLLTRFIHNYIVRNALFAIICVAFTWRAVNALLPRPRLMFVALTIFYVVVVELVMSRDKTGARSIAAIGSPGVQL
jgi:hypothetical protein